jgi:hypothetical protein
LYPNAPLVETTRNRAYARRTVRGIIEIGRRLAEVKKMVGRGNFLPGRTFWRSLAEDDIDPVVPITYRCAAMSQQWPCARFG